MLEHYTEAIVLYKEDINENDVSVHFYTEKMGKVVAKARGLKKMVSKSNPHLEPLNFVKARFVVGRNGRLQLIDALSFDWKIIKKIKNNSDSLIKFLKMADFIKEITFEHQPDLYLWQVIKLSIYKNEPEEKIHNNLLKCFGFNPKFAECQICVKTKPGYFHKKEQIFLCNNCALNFRENELILIE